MKNMLLQLLIFVFGVCLVGCSTNTQSENTGLGAVTGAVVGGLAGSAFGQGTGKAVAVGVGAVTGALVGGKVGHGMDSTDNRKVYRTMDYTPTNKTKTWTNKKTHRTYKVKPTSGMLNVKGNPNCRNFVTTSVDDGKETNVLGTACRQSDGTWKPATA